MFVEFVEPDAQESQSICNLINMRVSVPCKEKCHPLVEERSALQSHINPVFCLTSGSPSSSSDVSLSISQKLLQLVLVRGTSICVCDHLVDGRDGAALGWARTQTVVCEQQFTNHSIGSISSITLVLISFDNYLQVTEVAR